MSFQYPSVLVWKIFTSKHFFYMQLLLQTIFLCLCLPANTFFYLHTIYFSVYSLCKQFISKFSAFEQNYNCSFSSMALFVHLLISRRHFLFFFLYLGCCVLFQLTFSNPVLYTQDIPSLFGRLKITFPFLLESAGYYCGHRS